MRTTDRLSEDLRELFDARAPQWTAAYEAGGALADRAQLILDEIAALRPPPGRLLDFGCGTGHIANALADRGYGVEGLDLSPGMLAEGRRLFGHRLVLTELSPDWSVLPYQSAAFDVVLASSVLEYVHKPDVVLRELARVLRSGGLLVATVPNMRHPRRWIENALACAARKIPTRTILDLPPRIARHARFLRGSRVRYSDREWAGRFAAAGFVVERMALGSSPMLRLFALGRRAG